MQAERAQELVSIEGAIIGIKFKKDDYLIAQFQISTEVITIKGNLYSVERQERLILKGYWEEHFKYGKQFIVHQWKRPMPKTKEQVVKFLSSPLIKGCGEKQAARIAETLGENAIERIHKEGTEALEGIKGLGRKKSEMIVASVRANFELQEIISELKDYGIDTKEIIKVYQKEGSNTLPIIKKNPYYLTKFGSLDFFKADEIAQKIGISPTSNYRIESCLDYVINKLCFQQGHCFIEENQLFNETVKILNYHADVTRMVSKEDVFQTICRLENSGKRIVMEQGIVYPYKLYLYEKELAKRVAYFLNLKREALVTDEQISSWLYNFQRKNGMVLSFGQRQAVYEMFKNRLLILTGNPGTGKTTTLKVLIDIYKQAYKNAKITIAAPTGRASRRAEEITGIESSTIHRLLGIKGDGEVEYHKDNKLTYDLLILEEFSMIDIHLAYLLFEAIEKHTQVLIVGDKDQLASVAPGNVLRDLIKAGVPHVRLTEIFRQAQDSQIIMNAHRINRGEMIQVDHTKNDFYFIQKEQSEEIQEYILRSVIRFLQLGYKISDILVLTPQIKGIIGKLELNNRIRELVNPAAPNKQEIKVGERVFRQYDKVIQLRNDDDKGISNGDIGYVLGVDKTYNSEKNKEVEILICSFHNRRIEFTKEDLKNLDLGYAMTIHKSQGGEAPIVIMPISMSHHRMLVRNLLYTGFTRAKNILVLIGTIKAMHIAINNDAVEKRNSRLAERISLQVQPSFENVRHSS